MSERDELGEKPESGDTPDPEPAIRTLTQRKRVLSHFGQRNFMGVQTSQRFDFTRFIVP